MPAKRQHVNISEKLPAAVPEQCADIAAALQSTSSLPEACRLMLVEGLRHSLGVDPSDRDTGQDIIVSFIGEVLARRKAELATRAECFEADVSCAQTVADEHAEVARKAEDELTREESFVTAKRAIFDEDDKQLRLARDVVEAAESARSATEADISAKEREKELCHTGCKLSENGADSGESETQQSADTISEIQELASRLGLEQSLVGVFKFLAKKHQNDWSILERAAAKMIGETLAKYSVELVVKLEEGGPMMKTHVAAIDATNETLQAAQERQSISFASLRDAESKHAEVEKRYKALKDEALFSAAELERAQKELKAARGEVTAFTEGPMETFRALNGGSPAVERIPTIKSNPELREPKDIITAEPCLKKARIGLSPVTGLQMSPQCGA